MSVQLRFEEHSFELLEGETVLSCLERHGVSRPSSCRSGVCQSCVMKVTEGDVPSRAQTGLKPAWKAQGYVLACVCEPTASLSVADCDALTSYPARVVDVVEIGPRVLRVRIEVEGEFVFEPGQFLSLVRLEDGLTRPYSIANLPSEGALELHVAVLSDGRMSSWLAGATGAEVEVRGPSGECFYQADSPQQPMILAGTGTGLAPLLGVLRAALAAEHVGPLHLYHGSPKASGLYLLDELLALQARHPQLTVTGSVLENDTGSPSVRELPIDRAVLGDHPSLAGHRVYLCGNPELVRRLKKQAYLAGASLDRIHSDPFVTAPGGP